MPPLALLFYVNYFSKNPSVFYSFSQFIPYVKKCLFPPLSVKILHLFFPAAHTQKTPFRKRPKPFFQKRVLLNLRKSIKGLYVRSVCSGSCAVYIAAVHPCIDCHSTACPIGRFIEIIPFSIDHKPAGTHLSSGPVRYGI